MKKTLLFPLLFPAILQAAVPVEVTAQTSSFIADSLLVGGGFLAAIAGIKAFNLMRGAVDSDYSFYGSVESKLKVESSLATEARENEQEALEVADYWADEAEVHEGRVGAYSSLLGSR